MEGVLRVIPGPNCRMRSRKLTMRLPPSRLMIEDIIGGRIDLIPDFDSILSEGQATFCLAFRARGKNQEPNAFANLLWLQAMIRKHGFSGTRKTDATSISGSIAVLFGDDSYMRGVIEALLDPGKGF